MWRNLETFAPCSGFQSLLCNKGPPPRELRTAQRCSVMVSMGQGSGRFSWALCSGSHRADSTMSGGCLLMQRPLPSSFQFAGKSISCGHRWLRPLFPRYLSEPPTRDPLGSSLCSLFHNLAISLFLRPMEGQHLFPAPPCFQRPTWLTQAPQERPPFINPRSTWTASANPLAIQCDRVTGVISHNSHRSRPPSRGEGDDLRDHLDPPTTRGMSLSQVTILAAYLEILVISPDAWKGII